MIWKFELPKTQFERTVRDKIVCKTHLEWESDWFKHIFGILIKFPIQPEKQTKFGTVREKSSVSKFELPESLPGCPFL